MSLPKVRATVCPKCGNAMGEAPRYHALVGANEQTGKIDLNRFLPIHVYECQECRYLEIYGSGKPED